MSVLTFGAWLPVYALSWATVRWGCGRTALVALVLCVGVPVGVSLVHDHSMSPEERAAFDARVAARKAEAAEKREAEKIEKRCTGQSGTAYVMSQEHVKRRLRAPRTAKFPWTEFSVTPIGDCIYEVRAYVDAQNGFGAMIRTPYVARMKATPRDAWQLLALELRQ